MTEFTYSNDLISDLHKDAYGYRPREGFMHNWNQATDAERQEQWDWLVQVIERNNEEEAAQEKICISEFEELVNTTIEAGAGNRETALRWIMDASPAGRYNDWDFLCFERGLPYGYFRKAA